MAKTIMAVDDSASMRQLVSYSLKEAGYDVVLANHGKDALMQIGSKQIDLVLTDLNMPEMDGLALIRQLRSQAAHKFTPIIMLTTESMESRKLEGKSAGASGWIVKPFKPEQLVDVVRKFVR